jgi:hypothetical protein
LNAAPLEAGSTTRGWQHHSKLAAPLEAGSTARGWQHHSRLAASLEAGSTARGWQHHSRLAAPLEAGSTTRGWQHHSRLAAPLERSAGGSAVYCGKQHGCILSRTMHCNKQHACSEVPLHLYCTPAPKYHYTPTAHLLLSTTTPLEGQTSFCRKSDTISRLPPTASAERATPSATCCKATTRRLVAREPSLPRREEQRTARLPPASFHFQRQPTVLHDVISVVAEFMVRGNHSNIVHELCHW